MKFPLVRIALPLAFLFPLASQASSLQKSSNTIAKFYDCTFTKDSQVVGHGQLINASVVAHGSPSYDATISFADDAGDFVKANYGFANYARTEWNGIIGSFRYDLAGPEHVELRDMVGTHTASRTERYVGDINSRQDITTIQTIVIDQVAVDVFSIHMEIQDEPFVGAHSPLVPDADYLPRSVSFDGICR